MKTQSQMIPISIQVSIISFQLYSYLFLDKADPEAKAGGDEEFDSDAADRSTDSEDRGSSVVRSNLDPENYYHSGFRIGETQEEKRGQRKEASKGKVV